MKNQTNKTGKTKDPVREFLRKAGSKGGKQSAKHPDRKRLNKEAAESRWRKQIPEPKKIPEKTT